MSRRSVALRILFLCGFSVLPLAAPSMTYFLTLTLALGLSALAVALLMRAGLLSFGHALYFSIGAYGAAYLATSTHLDGALAIIAAAILSGLAAFGIGWFVVRYRGIFFAMLNLALSMLAYTALLKFYNITGGSDGVPVVFRRFGGVVFSPESFAVALFYTSLASSVILSLLLARYLRSPPGFALSAIRENEIRVEYLGVSVTGVLLLAYTLSGLLAGLGGALAAAAIGHVDPGLAYWTRSAEFVVAAVLGGVDNVGGPFLGAALYEAVSVTAPRYLTYSWGFLLGLIIFLVIRFLPDGLSSLAQKSRERRQ